MNPRRVRRPRPETKYEWSDLLSYPDPQRPEFIVRIGKTLRATRDGQIVGEKNFYKDPRRKKVAIGLFRIGMAFRRHRPYAGIRFSGIDRL